MTLELLHDDPVSADELLALRRDIAALRVALADKEQANKALRLENAELKFKAAQFASRVRSVTEEYLK